MPTHTPIGTQTTVASAMSTTTRISVASPSSIAVPTSASVMPSVKKRSACHNANAVSAKTIKPNWNAIQPGRVRGARLTASTLSGCRGSNRRRHSTANGRVTRSTMRDRRRMSSTQERGATMPGSCSKRKRSAQATSGRNRIWS